jgi:uncharacterized protein (DUF1330 family)
VPPVAEQWVTLCVLLWARAGQERMLLDYEDRVLGLLPAHGARITSRVRSLDSDHGPLEVQVIEFPSEQAIDAYMRDPARVALSGQRAKAIERTEMFRVARVTT